MSILSARSHFIAAKDRSSPKNAKSHLDAGLEQLLNEVVRISEKISALEMRIVALEHDKAFGEAKRESPFR